MKSYSIDLRERVLRAVELREETQLEVAERFDVSRAWIGKLCQQWRNSGSLAPRPHGGGRPAKYAHADLEKLRIEVLKQPDATLAELRQRTGALGSIMAVDRALAKLHVRFKKNPRGRRSRTVPTCSGNAVLSRSGVS
jgi:transposase